MNKQKKVEAAIKKTVLLLKRNGKMALCVMLLAGGFTYIISNIFSGVRFDAKLYISSSGNIPRHTAVNDCCTLFNSRSVKTQLDQDLDRNWKKLKDIPYRFRITTEKDSDFITCSFYSRNDKKAMASAIAGVLVFVNNAHRIMGDNVVVKVVDQPHRIPFSQTPGIWHICTLSALLCGILTFLAGSVWNFFNSVIKSSEQSREETGLAALGVIPDISNFLSTNNQKHLVHTLRQDENHNFSFIYEQFQTCLTNLRFTLPSTHAGTVSILITSITSGDGKSFISANIAQLLALRKKRILLIGCDLRHPALHNYFSLNRQNGLVNLVLGEKSFEDSVIKNVDGLPLDILPSGPVPPDPLSILEIFCDSGFREKYASEYDYVIYDCPPLNMADALYFAKHADHVLLVIRSGITPVRQIRKAHARLKAIGLKISGVIINRVRPENQEPFKRHSDFYPGFNHTHNTRGSFIKHFFKPHKKKDF